MSYRPLICFDFDGVLSKRPEYHWPLEAADFAPLREAHERGYAVAVMTCNTVELVAAELRRYGFDVLADPDMVRGSWHGGADGVTVLVTGRKLSARAYVDDRALHWRFGDDPENIWAELDRRQDEASGFRSCPAGRHWGPRGAAGVIPWCQWRGGVWVLLSLRSRHVQRGGTWSTFGGAIDQGETARQAAVRELGEEVTGLRAGHLRRQVVWQCPERCGWRYTTFAVEVPAGDRLLAVRIKRAAAWETDDVRWVPLEEVGGLDLHPDFGGANWDRLSRALLALASRDSSELSRR